MTELERLEERLIALYAKHTVEDLRSKPVLLEQTFCRSIEELSQDRPFTLFKEYIETQKRYIEDRQASLTVPTAREQVAACLRMLLRPALFPEAVQTAFERRLRTLGKLLTAMYATGWSQDQQGHFEYMLASLISWKSYFLSYTNRGARATNERFRKVIRRSPSKIWRNRSWDDNILADVIVNSLSVRNVQRSFYDKKDIGPGQDLKGSIGPAIDNVFCFIQLVHVDTFTNAEDNYCFLEWTLFDESSAQKLSGRSYFSAIFQDRFSAMLTNERDTLFPDPIPVGYERWRDTVFHEKLHTTLSTDPEKFDATMRSLTSRIVRLQEEILATVPG